MDSSELTPEEIPEPRAALPTDLDEDLFDFPTAEAQPASSDSLSVAKEAALAIQASNEILVRKPQSAPGPGDGSDLDEDIFSFGELFTDAESTAGDEVIAYYSEEEAEVETPPAPSHEDRSEQAPASAPAPAPESAEIPSAAKPRKRARATRPTPPTPVPRGSGSKAPGPAPAAVIPVSPATNSLENRLVLTLALGFILVNAALILTAWQASESFQSTLDYVRTDLSSALTDIRVQGELHAAGPELGPEPAQAITPEADPVGQEPTPLASFQELELALAQEELENGAYGDARIRLYRLLANADRLVLDESQLADAEFLIGETYFAQGKSLPEERP